MGNIGTALPGKSVEEDDWQFGADLEFRFPNEQAQPPQAELDMLQAQALLER